MTKKLDRTYTVSQQRVAEWINGHEDQAQLMYELGVYDEATKAAIVANDEKVLLKVTDDPDFAKKIEQGEKRSEAVTEAGGDVAAEHSNG